MQMVKDVLSQEKNKLAIISLLRAADIPIEYFEIVEESIFIPEDAPEEIKKLLSSLSKISEEEGEGLKKI